ncbi:TPA: accessory Sec system protein Asp1 [Streptococcus suis]
MYYFVPSWYSKERKWSADTPVWFRTFEQMSFDDTINQVKMFDHADEEAGLILLSYQPQLHYFFHKHGLHRVSYWSFFDDIQNISVANQVAIHFKDLNWPEGTQFIYSPFAAVAQTEAGKLAEIHFAENGNLLFIQFYRQDQQDKKYIFDDRGFLSSLVYYRDNQPYYQDYLNTNGVWQVREWLVENDYLLEINPVSDKSMARSFYHSWEELMLERLEVFKSLHVKESDVLVITADRQHASMFLSVFPLHHKMFSFFGQRFDMEDKELLSSILLFSKHILVDTSTREEELLHFIAYQGLTDVSLHRITPFDTRLRLGQSQLLREIILYCLVDGVEELSKLYPILLNIMEKNPNIQLHFVTYQKDYPLQYLENQIVNHIYEARDVNRFFTTKSLMGENQIDEGEDDFNLKSIQFECLTNENQIIQQLDTARLVLDLSPQPDLYTQIAAISAGVPQINRVQTAYVQHKENGWVLKHTGDLEAAVQYFCDGLANWNRSLVKSVELMTDYTGGNLIKQWKEFFEN